MQMPIHLKRIIATINSKTITPDADRSTILLYHSVGSGTSSLDTEIFTKQLAWLKENASVGKRLENVTRAPTSTKPVINITFDDGYASLLKVAAPLMKEFGFTATVFLTTNCISDTQPMRSNTDSGHYPDEDFLTWEEVSRLRHEYGWTIGSHGADHIDLTRQPPDIIKHQLKSSKSTIEQYMNVPCHLFAYTWGYHNPQIQKLISETGYKMAFAGHHGNTRKNRNDFAIPRINVDNRWNISDFAGAVMGYWDFLSVAQRARLAFRNLQGY